MPINEVLAFGGSFAMPCCFYLLLIPVGLFIGAVFSFIIGIKQKSTVKTKILRIIPFGFLIFLMLAIWHIIYMVSVNRDNNDYWKARGTVNSFTFKREDYRMPLEYPYELKISNFDKLGNICPWWDAAPERYKPHKRGCYIVVDIKEYFKFGSYVVGLTESSYVSYNAFIFNCKNGELQTFDQDELFLEALKAIGINGKNEFIEPLTQWELFWSDSKNWKNKQVPE